MSNDMKFASSLTDAWIEKDYKPARYLFLTILSFLIILVIWAGLTKLEVVTKSRGSVVPSDSIHVVDNLEGGILSKINVSEGDIITKGTLLLKIDNSSYLSALQENIKKQSALEITKQRLFAELESKEFKVLDKNNTSYINEQRFFKARNQQYKEKQLAYNNQIRDTKKEIAENRTALIRLEAEVSDKEPIFPKSLSKVVPVSVEIEKRTYQTRKSYRESEKKILEQLLENLEQEHKVLVELEKQGAASQMEVLKLQRGILEARSRLDKLSEVFLNEINTERKKRREIILAQQKTLSGFESTLIDLDKERLSQISDEFRKVESELDLLKEQQSSLKDKVDRSSVYSPIDGVVNKIYMQSPGKVIKSAEPIIEITPSSESLLVEVSIEPTDIAFIRANQKAIVKVDAYDFSIYGGLEGKVVFISPDTHEDEEGKAFYTVRVKTKKNYIGKDKENLIISGMSLEADLISGERTLLHYLFKPLLRMNEEAFRER